jgi:YD repeat-containing protein
MTYKYSAALAMAMLPLCYSPASAQNDATTYASSFAAPVFDSVDSQGVDLVRGKMRVSTPIIQAGEGQYRQVRGLLWTGQAWSIIGQPSIWRDGSKYIVSYRGRSEEFNNRKSGYSGRKPVMGGKLTCNVTAPGDLAVACFYTDRDGDVVFFNGRPSTYASTSKSYGMSALFLGNLGMYNALVRSFNRPIEFFGQYSFNGLGVEQYNQGWFRLTLGKQNLLITTPNQNGKNYEDSYLRPKGTTQSITDDNGNVWQYTFNDDRNMTRIDFPAGASSVSIDYNRDGKVQYVRTAAGTWTYDYLAGRNGYASTLVIAPDGNRRMVRYHMDSGIVSNLYENYDPTMSAFRRETRYDIDLDTYRVTRVTFPEGNYTDYKYDSRGNVTSKISNPKPGSALIATSVSASYSPSCQYTTTCNQPSAVTDEFNNTTYLTYKNPEKVINYTNDSQKYEYDFGPNGPVKITSPKLSVSGIIPETKFEYSGGLVSKKVECRVLSPCDGTSDAVITTYRYGAFFGLMEMAVTSDGRTLRTCYGLDSNGRRVSEIPPAAGIGECPNNTTTALEPKDTPPSTDRTPTPPVWPETTSSGNPSNPTNPNDPYEPIERCGAQYRVVCQ